VLRRLLDLLPVIRYRVEGESMTPAYSPGDRLLINRLAYVARTPRPGDVVVLRDPEEPERLLLKRVESAGGEGIVVMGDNLDASRDSRRFGPVRREDVVGKVIARY
jgi:nickel-type superoxide dismutase maturation protease